MNTLTRWIERAALAVCASAVFLMMLIGAVDIVMGNTVGFFLSFKVELSGTLLASCIFLACAPVQRASEHIRVDLFDPQMGPALKRFRDIASILCGLLVIGLIAYGLWQQALRSVQIMETSADTLGFPVWPWKVVSATGASMCFLTLLGQLIHGLLPDLRITTKENA